MTPRETRLQSALAEALATLGGIIRTSGAALPSDHDALDRLNGVLNQASGSDPCIGCSSPLSPATFDGKPLERSLCNTCEMERVLGMFAQLAQPLVTSDPVVRAACLEAQIAVGVALLRLRSQVSGR